MKSKKLPVLIAALLVLSLAANGYLFYSLHQQQGQTAALMVQHTAQLDELAKEQAAQLETLTADHAAETERLNQEHAAAIAELKAMYDAEIVNLQESQQKSAANMEPTAATTSPTQSSKTPANPNPNNGRDPDPKDEPIKHDLHRSADEVPEKPGYVWVPGFGYIEGEWGDLSGNDILEPEDMPNVWEIDPADKIPGAY